MKCKYGVVDGLEIRPIDIKPVKIAVEHERLSSPLTLIASNSTSSAKGLPYKPPAIQRQSTLNLAALARVAGE